ncbi:MAG TPA: UpxY family transcription antiterminator [Terriglobales bacterium]|nr:UpxY family transcription antiterminator [Terriglobales bacterium]
MSSGNQSWEFPNMVPILGSGIENWYAVHTRARHERVVAQRLREQGVTTFLPLITEVHRWSDRRKSVEVPLFGCYVFVKLPPTGEDRLRVLRIDGVFKFVGARGVGTPIADAQIDAVRTLIGQQIPWSTHPFLQIGHRVRVRGGALDGVEGILLSRNDDNTLVVSIDAIQRSLAVRIQGYDVEPL